MAINSFGDAALKQQPGSVYKVARNGLATYDVTWEGELTGPIPFTQGDSPAEYPNVVLMECSVETSGKACDQVLLKLHYEGYDETFTNDIIRLDSTLEIATNQEPIETHPNFLDFAGARGEDGRSSYEGLNGAIYEEQNGFFQFSYFKHEIEGDAGPEFNRFSGVKAYLYPIETFTQNRIDETWPSAADDLSYLGKILDSQWLEDNVPTLPDGQNWLYTGVRVRSIGNVYFDAQRTASTSGPRGWIPEIYELGFYP